MAQYKEEGIDTSAILSHFQDVSPTLELLEGRPLEAPTLSNGANNENREPVSPCSSRAVSALGGSPRAAMLAPSGAPGLQSVCLLSLLDDDTRYSERAQQREGGGGTRDDKFVKKVIEALGTQRGFVKSNGRRWDEPSQAWVAASGYDRKSFQHAHFAISHFGATVPYSAKDFCDKNADPLDVELQRLMGSCDAEGAAAPFTRMLFAQPTSAHRSISFKFRDEMGSLIETLNRCEGHFIRCIKPNDERKPFLLDPEMTRAQLQSCGVLEAAKVSQAGYPKRIPFRDFVLRFMGDHALRKIKPHMLPDAERGKLAKAVATKVLRLVDHRDFELGKTRIFLRRGVWEQAMQRQRKLLAVIGPIAPGGGATGLRKVRVMRRLRALRESIDQIKEDRDLREKLKAQQKEREAKEQAEREEAERLRQEQVEKMVEAAAVAAAKAAEAEAARELSEAMEAERVRRAELEAKMREEQIEQARLATEMREREEAKARDAAQASQAAQEQLRLAKEDALQALHEAEAAKMRAIEESSRTAEGLEEYKEAAAAEKAAALLHAQQGARDELERALATAAEEKAAAVAKVEKSKADALAWWRNELDSKLADARAEMAAALASAAAEKAAVVEAGDAERSAASEALAAAKAEAAVALSAAQEEKTRALEAAAAAHEEELRKQLHSAKQAAAMQLNTELEIAAEEKAAAIEELNSKAAAERAEYEGVIDGLRNEKSDLQHEVAIMSSRLEELMELRREADWQRRELERLQMRLRKEEREAEAMIVEHTKFEINFYSDLERLKTSLKGAIPEFGKLKEDARFWYRRGFEINQTVGSASGGKATLSRVDRLKTKAARALILHAAVLAGTKLGRPDEELLRRSRAKRSTMSLIFEEGNEKKELAQEKQQEQRAMYSYHLAAANMTRKLDASSALSEYEMLLKLLETHRLLGSSAYDDLHARCLKSHGEASEIVQQQWAEKKEAEKKMVLERRPTLTEWSAGDSSSTLNATRAPAQLVPQFGLRSTPANIGAISFEYANGRYTVDLHSEALARVRAAGYSPDSQMTPLKSLGLTESQKQKLNIPIEASMFAFAFPLPGSFSTGIHKFEPTTPEELAAAYGAWAYFKDADHAIALHAVSVVEAPEKGLSTRVYPQASAFLGPYRLQSKPGEEKKISDGIKMREYLIETGRFQSSSLESLKQCGVRYSWWLGPSEPVAAEDGSAWPNGAFVYLYHEGEESFDCFLAAADPSETTIGQGNNGGGSTTASSPSSAPSSDCSPTSSVGNAGSPADADGVAAHLAFNRLARSDTIAM